MMVLIKRKFSFYFVTLMIADCNNQDFLFFCRIVGANDGGAIMIRRNHTNYIPALTVLLTKEFNRVLAAATNNRNCYSFLVLDLKTSGDVNHLFFVPLEHLDTLHNSMESILESSNVSTTTVEIPWSSQYAPMFLSESIANTLGLNMDEYFSTPACRVEYTDDVDALPLFAIMFGKQMEWPYQSPIINLFVSFIDYINKQKKSFSLERINTVNIDGTVAQACDYASILRAACERELIYRFTGKRVTQIPRKGSFFDLVCNLACMAYEGTPNTGYLRFTSETTIAKSTIRFAKSVACTIENRRELRKLLAMTNSDNGLLVTKEEAVGLTSGKQFRSFIRFDGNGKWKLYLNDTDHPIVSVEGNVCSFCTTEVTNEFHPAFQSVFGDEGDPNTIKAIVDEAKQQKHGTSIIISECAEEEAERLAKYSRAIRIVPISFAERSGISGVIQALTAIDGALLVSLSGECYAIGAILDGEVCSDGSTARGARYNSLANYVTWKSKSTEKHPNGIRSMAVVISEDQTVDFIPPKANE